MGGTGAQCLCQQHWHSSSTSLGKGIQMDAQCPQLNGEQCVCATPSAPAALIPLLLNVRWILLLIRLLYSQIIIFYFPSYYLHMEKADFSFLLSLSRKDDVWYRAEKSKGRFRHKAEIQHLSQGSPKEELLALLLTPILLRSNTKQGHNQVCTPLLSRNTSLLRHCRHSAAHNNTLHSVCSHLHFQALLTGFTTSLKIHLNSPSCPYMQCLFLSMSQAPPFTELQTPQNTHSLQSFPLPARISKLTESQFRSSVHLAGFDFLPKLPSPSTPDFFTHLQVICAVQYCSMISFSSVS